MNTAHGTLQVTDEQIIVIIHLVLQVYCSPSLKEHLHNPVMPLLTRNKERKETILRAHGGMCACVCVVVVCEYIRVCLCVACGCVVMCTYTALVPVHSECWIQTYKCMYMYQ